LAADGGKLTTEEATALDAKATEAMALQKEITSYDERQRVLAEGRKLKDPEVLPADDQPGSKPATGRAQTNRAIDGKRLVGFMTLGDFVVAQKAIHDFVERGMPKESHVLAKVHGVGLFRRRHGGPPLVGVSEPMVKAIDALYELKAVPTIGTDPVVIEPTRDTDLVRVTEQDRLRLRDILTIGTTASDAVKYTRIVSYTRAASAVARSAPKPESAISIDAVTEPVRTLAVHMPVEDQQLSDLPQLQGIINGELLYDLDKHVEELIMYGDGTGENFTGVLVDPAVQDARTEVGDSLIDIARRGITDVRRAGYEPNGILVDPLDWEDIVLEKGSDNRYVWVVVTEGATQRLWAVPVVETVAMQDFAGVATEQRHLLVGDFNLGATLWDRERSAISTGWINDQFIRNQRTILAELRAAFGVKRPGAFRKHLTQEASAS
jgi:HK97 family phage major capsid protein